MKPLEDALGTSLHNRLRAHLPARLQKFLEPERLRLSGRTDSIELDAAEDFLQALEEALGDHSGHLLEEAAFDIFSHTLAQERAANDEALTTTIARLQPTFERLFSGSVPIFQVWRAPFGIAFVVAVKGRPRLAEPLRKIGLGAMRASRRANAEATGFREPLELYSGVHRDRAWIRADVVSDARRRVDTLRSMSPSRSLKAI